MRNPLDLIFRPGRLQQPSTSTSPASLEEEQDALLHKTTTTTSSKAAKQEDYRSVDDAEAAATAASATTTTFDQACYFITQVTLAAYSYGSGALQIENVLPVLATTLGLDSSDGNSVFQLTPNAIVLAFAAQDEENNTNDAAAPQQQQRVQLLDYPPVTMDMSKLAAVKELVLQVIDGKTTVDEALTCLEEIHDRPHPFGKLQFLASSPTIAIGVVPMFQGSWWDLLLALPLSLLVAVLSLSNNISGDLLPVVAGMLVTLIATTVKATLLSGLDVYVVTLAAVMTLLPGLSVTIGTAELTNSHHTSSGLVTVIQGVIYLVKLGGGAWIGYALVSSLPVFQLPPHHYARPIDPAWIWIMFPIEIWGLCAYTLMARRDFIPAALNCLVGYFGSQVGNYVLKDKNFGAFLGGILIFLFGNSWSNKTRRPASIVITPVMYYMVASTSAFHGTVEMAEKESEAGKRDFMQMFTTAVMLMAGFIVGNGLVPQMKPTL